MREEWKSVSGMYADYYAVSSLGRVMNLRTNKILAHGLSRGYPKVNLSVKSVKTMFEIHRLVAIAFIDNPLSLRYVNHKNGIKTDNRIENLEWVTQSENNLHAYRTGLRISLKGIRQHTAKLTDVSVMVVREARKQGHRIADIARYFKMKPAAISAAARGLSWTHIPI